MIMGCSSPADDVFSASRESHKKMRVLLLLFCIESPFHLHDFQRCYVPRLELTRVDNCNMIKWKTHKNRKICKAVKILFCISKYKLFIYIINVYLNRCLILILLRDLIIWITYKLFFCSGTYHKNFFILIHIKKERNFIFSCLLFSLLINSLKHN